MALEVKQLKRKFEIDRKENTVYLDDPNEEMTVEEVIDFYSSSYPELMNATYSSHEVDNTLIFKFKSVAGVKG